MRRLYSEQFTGSILDAGGGSGMYAEVLAAAGLDVVIADVDDGMLDAARRRGLDPARIVRVTRPGGAVLLALGGGGNPGRRARRPRSCGRRVRRRRDDVRRHSLRRRRPNSECRTAHRPDDAHPVPFGRRNRIPDLPAIGPDAECAGPCRSLPTMREMLAPWGTIHGKRPVAMRRGRRRNPRPHPRKRKSSPASYWASSCAWPAWQSPSCR